MKQELLRCKNKLTGTEGINTVEVVLILVVLVALVLVFKTQILAVADTIFTQINKSIKKVY